MSDVIKDIEALATATDTPYRLIYSSRFGWHIAPTYLYDTDKGEGYERSLEAAFAKQVGQLSGQIENWASENEVARIGIEKRRDLIRGFTTHANE